VYCTVRPWNIPHYLNKLTLHYDQEVPLAVEQLTKKYIFLCNASTWIFRIKISNACELMTSPYIGRAFEFDSVSKLPVKESIMYYKKSTIKI